MKDVPFVPLEQIGDDGTSFLGSPLSAAEAMLICTERQKLMSTSYDGELKDVRSLVDVSLAFPFVAPDHYSLVLEDSHTRQWVGKLRGRKLVDGVETRGRPGGARGEYACVLIRGRPNVVIEYLNPAHHLSSVIVAVNGSSEAEMRSCDGRAFHAGNQRDVLINGSVFGIVEGGVGWFSSDLAVRRDHARLPIPLRFGHTANEVLLIMLRLLTLKFLWSNTVPENRNRVVDRAAADQLTDQELVVYFAVCLYFVASVHQFAIAGE